MGFTEKTPQYGACIKLIEAFSPKHRTSHTEVVDLTSPTEDDATAINKNEILFVNTKLQQEGGREKTKTSHILQEDEEHENQGEETTKDDKQAEK